MSIIHLAKQLVAISETEDFEADTKMGYEDGCIMVGVTAVEGDELRDLAIIGAHHLTQKMKRQYNYDENKQKTNL